MKKPSLAIGAGFAALFFGSVVLTGCNIHGFDDDGVFATADHPVLRWPDGFVCPRCGGRKHGVIGPRRLFQCSACRYQASVKAGTVFAAHWVPGAPWPRLRRRTAGGAGPASAPRT